MISGPSPGTSPPALPQLNAQGISKSFDGRRALDAVDFTLRAGEIHGLLGENGAGKSTLMNVLAGLLQPDSGSVTAAGQPLRIGSPSESAAVGIGMVHQHFSLVPALSVAENLSLAAAAGPAVFRRGDDLAGGALSVAERLGWRFDPSRPVWQLSIGGQQRLEILKALQRDARWLLFDEPTAVLSPPEVDELFGLLDRLRREGRGIVFITHKLPEVLRVCDRVTVLRRGRRVGELSRGATAQELARLMIGDAVGQAGEERDRDPTPAPFGSRSTPASPALAVEALCVRDDRGAEAVRGLSFEVSRGEIFGIAGVDGNGQAELSEAVVGLRSPSAGRVILGANRPDQSVGEDPVDAASSKLEFVRPGYIPQDRRRFGLILSMSVRENLALELHAAPTFRWGPCLRLNRLWQATRAMMRRFDVRVADEQMPVQSLSGGNQQKIVIARALTGRRSLLVAVNPTRGLDVAAARYVHEQLRHARGEGVGVLLISTELDEVLSLSDRVAVLYAGRLQGIVSPTESRQRIGQMMGGVGGT